MQREIVNGYDTSAEDLLTLDARWYEKVSLFINNFNKVLQRLCIRHGFFVSIDDKMNKFKVRPI